MVANFGNTVINLLWSLAKWAGIQISNAKDFTVEIIKAILLKMLVTVKTASNSALDAVQRNITPASLYLW